MHHSLTQGTHKPIRYFKVNFRIASSKNTDTCPSLERVTKDTLRLRPAENPGSALTDFQWPGTELALSSHYGKLSLLPKFWSRRAFIYSSSKRRTPATKAFLGHPSASPDGSSQWLRKRPLRRPSRDSALQFFKSCCVLRCSTPKFRWLRLPERPDCPGSPAV